MFLHNFFERQVDLLPHKPAIIFGQSTWTYFQVERLSNQLAHRLKDIGIGPGKLVGIYLDRSEKPIISILAILKAGGGYVPIDPNCPQERILHILTTADIDTVITESSLSGQFPQNNVNNMIILDHEQDNLARQLDQRIPTSTLQIKPDDICYVIFTSGTTGRPKGVVVEHRNAVNFVQSFSMVCQLNSHDRIYQGFSLGFDGSIEEIWMAYASGAALVVANGEVCKIGSEVARLINEQQVTFFSTVPTLLSLINEELPSVRLLIVSGEVCSPELVEIWANGKRRMLNVYGPTETTVNATYDECSPGKPITIGLPLRNYEVFVLDENLQPVQQGNCGELFIGGLGVSRGYLNQPEMTTKHFMERNRDKQLVSDKIYKTGDLVKINPDGKLVFLGRVDSQVKIRGYRIEITEIESVLSEHSDIQTAAVKVIENESVQELAAFVVLSPRVAGLDRDSVLELCKNRLPDYMVPSYLDSIQTLPRLASGKVDRTLLPDQVTPLYKKSTQVIAPTNCLEKQIVTIFEQVTKVTPISIEDNFFTDLGGYSLLAAQAVTLLRESFELDVAIRDIYENPTAKKLADCLDIQSQSAFSEVEMAGEREGSPKNDIAPVSCLTRGLCHFFQAISLMLFYGAYPALLTLYVLLGTMFVEEQLTLLGTLSGGIAITLGAYFLGLVLIIACKWLVIGRFKVGEYPLWGLYYFRWWFVSRLQNFSGMNLFVGTPIINLFWRLMGAKIGKGVTLDTDLGSAFDLISVGDNSSVGNETQLLGYRVQNGKLILGSVNIGQRCFVGIHSCLGLNTVMEDDSALGDLSLLPDSTRIEKGAYVKGSPAKPSSLTVSAYPTYKRHPIRYSLIHTVAIAFMGFFLFAAQLPIALLILWVFHNWGGSFGLVSIYLSLPLGILTFCLSVALAKYILLPRVSAGVYPIESGFYVRKWLIDSLMRLSTKALKPLYTTIYLPTWLRMLGAKIGRRAEISTVSQISPELITIDDESFFADGAIIAGRHFHLGYIELSCSYIGKRSFLGNNAILPIGSDIGNNCLLGCLSSPPESYQRIPDNSEWLGSPSFRLPHRKKVGGFSERVTFKPTLKLYVQRLTIDALRILIPGVIGVTGLLGLSVVSYLSLSSLGLAKTLLISPLMGILSALFFICTVVLLKTMVMGTYKPVIKPLWSVYVWLNEMINGAYESVFAPTVIPLLGTPYCVPFFKAMGCKIGKRAFIETTLFSEFDLVSIGDDVAINKGVVVQNHLFEDRIMKSDFLHIGNACNVGNMTVVLYSSTMGDGATIGPLSLLMKGEVLQQNSQLQGIPIESV
ncbi:MAG: amino acid adenylation domain-containing protein [Deltaproteobacteria bacterium]|jgi:non-ribosomal peptide synthetase-like protein|nr:amino acid adenylation domain-containing protein [Deltaproteobacteria bacterium]